MSRGNVALALAAFLLVPAAGQDRAADLPAISGHNAFLQRCGGCHLESGFGTRVLSRRTPPGQSQLEARRPLPEALIRLAVRRGVGSMPQIRAAELDDRTLSAIAAYLASPR